MTGAKVNGRMVPFDYPLHNGDIVEVITSKAAKGPSRDWLKICKSNEARNKIRQWFKKERREENIATGRAAFEAELKHMGIPLAAITAEEVLPHILREGPLRHPGRAVRRHRLRRHHRPRSGGPGQGRAAAPGPAPGGEGRRCGQDHGGERIVPGWRPGAEPAPPPGHKHTDSGIIVEGLGNCLVKFAKCCTPVPGDPVVGFITRGYRRVRPPGRLPQRRPGKAQAGGGGPLGQGLLGQRASCPTTRPPWSSPPRTGTA